MEKEVKKTKIQNSFDRVKEDINMLKYGFYVCGILTIINIIIYMRL